MAWALGTRGTLEQASEKRRPGRGGGTCWSWPVALCRESGGDNGTGGSCGFPSAGIFHRPPVEHVALLVAGGVGWPDPATAGRPAAGDARGRGGGQVRREGPAPAAPGSLTGASGVVSCCHQDVAGLFTGAWAGLSQIQVSVATHPAGPEVHSLGPGLHADAWLPDALGVPGEPQPELPPDGSVPETRPAQEAARGPEAGGGEDTAGPGVSRGWWVCAAGVTCGARAQRPRPRPAS